MLLSFRVELIVALPVLILFAYMFPGFFRPLFMLIVMLLIGVGSPAHADDLGLADLGRIHSTYENNQARFFRDFGEKRFSSKMPIARATENPILRGTFNVYFGSGGLVGEAECEFSDANDIARITDMNKGDVVKVSGIIKDHTFGALVLKDCSISSETTPDTPTHSGSTAKPPAPEPRKRTGNLNPVLFEQSSAWLGPDQLPATCRQPR